MDPAIGKTGGCQCGSIRYQLNGDSCFTQEPADEEMLTSLWQQQSADS